MAAARTGLQSPIRELIPELADLPREAHPFAAAYVRRFDTMMIEPSVYLDADYAEMKDDLYMFSRHDGILLGGTHEKAVFTLEPDLAARQRILAGHAQLFAPLMGG